MSAQWALLTTVSAAAGIGSAAGSGGSAVRRGITRPPIGTATAARAAHTQNAHWKPPVSAAPGVAPGDTGQPSDRGRAERERRPGAGDEQRPGQVSPGSAVHADLCRPQRRARDQHHSRRQDRHRSDADDEPLGQTGQRHRGQRRRPGLLCRVAEHQSQVQRRDEQERVEAAAEREPDRVGARAAAASKHPQRKQRRLDPCVDDDERDEQDAGAPTPVLIRTSLGFRSSSGRCITSRHLAAGIRETLGRTSASTSVSMGAGRTELVAGSCRLGP